jgi:bifunctional non-homologous end joining protein LigD
VDTVGCRRVGRPHSFNLGHRPSENGPLTINGASTNRDHSPSQKGPVTINGTSTQFRDTLTLPPRSEESVAQGTVTVVRPSGFIDPCTPTRAFKVPSHPDWIHEVKHDGYRLQVRREGQAVCLFTRRGYDWTERYPAIAAAAAKVRAQSFTLDGEAVVCGADGIAVFDTLHRRGTVREAILQAFDLLELDGADLRSLPLAERKARLARLLRRPPAGLELNANTDDDGSTVFAAACRMGLEGIVSKRLTAPYRSGPSRDWLKVKNPDSAAMLRHREERW